MFLKGKKPIKTVLFGGTFDPVHRGHVDMITSLVSEVIPEKIIVIPNKVPPHKSMPLATDQQRLDMLALALPYFPLQKTIEYQVSSNELQREGTSYMVDTVKDMGLVLGQSKLGLLIGGDSFLSLHTWHCYQKLVQSVVLYVAPRHGIAYEEYEAYPYVSSSDVHVLSSIPISVSSSSIRSSQAMSGISEVDHYIVQNKVYQ